MSDGVVIKTRSKVKSPNHEEGHIFDPHAQGDNVAAEDIVRHCQSNKSSSDRSHRLKDTATGSHSYKADATRESGEGWGTGYPLQTTNYSYEDWYNPYHTMPWYSGDYSQGGHPHGDVFNQGDNAYSWDRYHDPQGAHTLSNYQNMGYGNYYSY